MMSNTLESISEKQSRATLFLHHPSTKGFSFWKSSSSSYSQRIIDENDYIILLHEENAISMNIKNEDFVLVTCICGNKDENICNKKFRALCHARIEKRRKDGHLSMGEAMLGPSYLYHRFIEEHQLKNEKIKTKNKTLNNQIIDKIYDESFSFHQGDKQNYTPIKKHNRHDLTLVHILPVNTNRSIANSWLSSKVASQITFRIMDACLTHTSDIYQESLRQSKHVLDIMVRMCWKGFRCVGDELVISFLGRKIRLKIVDIDPEVTKSKIVGFGEDKETDIKFITKSLQNCTMNYYDGSENKCSVDSRKIQSNIEFPDSFLWKIGEHTLIKFIIFENFISTVKRTIHIEPKTSNSNLVAGLDSIIHEVKQTLVPSLLYPEIFGSTKPMKGVLLYGAYGTGKSLLGLQVARDIQNLNVLYQDNVMIKCDPHDDVNKTFRNMKNNSLRSVDVVKINCANIIANSWKDEKKLVSLFEDAERKAIHEKISTLIILDDVHLISSKNCAADTHFYRINRILLDLLDGISLSPIESKLYPSQSFQPANNTISGRNKYKSGSVVVLAITQDPSLIDPAMRRSGRLDVEIEVPIPDDSTRYEIFQFLLMKMRNQREKNIQIPLLKKSDLMKLARKAKAFTGSDCFLALKEAVRMSVLRTRKAHEGHDISSTPSFAVSFNDIQSAIRTVKPTCIRSISIEIPQVPWTSIGGMSSVKAQLQESIELPLTHPQLFSALNIQPPKGILLYGPPGCSKTLMARALATEGKMNFLAVKGPELLSKWLGESERLLANLFRRARMASPCVIFFDEIDAIGCQRGVNQGSGGTERLLSQLLTEMDSTRLRTGIQMEHIEKSIRVVIVGATNRPDLLDCALIRPGRIDKMIYVGLPDETSRREILRIGLEGKAYDETNIDLNEFASENISQGYSGAELISICRDAAIFAIEEYESSGGRIEIMIRYKNLIRAVKETKPQITKKMLEMYANFSRSKTKVCHELSKCLICL